MRRVRSWVTSDLDDLETRSLGRKTGNKDNSADMCNITFLSDTEVLQVNISHDKAQFMTSDLFDLVNQVTGSLFLLAK